MQEKILKKNKTNDDLILSENFSLKELQLYIKDLEEIRGFSSESILDKCILLGEEVGELFKAIRKVQGIKFDSNDTRKHDIAHELSDVLLFVCAIANRYNIDLETALREKEEINKKRSWK